MVEAEPEVAGPATVSSLDLDHEPQWAQYFDNDEMESYVTAGLCQCIETKEQIGIHPYWLRDAELGAMEELKKDLGKYCRKYDGYLLGVKRPRQVPVPGKQNHYPQPFVFYTFDTVRYIYKPAVGQILQGCLSRIGKNAGTCIVFGKFTATVAPASEDEFSKWNTGDVVTFELESYDNLRKGVILRGTSCVDAKTKKKKSKRMREEVEMGIPGPEVSETELPLKKKRKLKQEDHS